MPGRPAAAPAATAAAAATVIQQPEAEPQVTPTSSSNGHSDNDQVCQILGDLPTCLFYIDAFSLPGAESNYASRCQYQRNQC